jgi:uncharacterized membrane protein
MDKKMEKNKKLLLITIAIFLISATLIAYAAYLVTVIPGTVSVNEPISVSPTSFTLTMYAGETQNETITVTNAANAIFTVHISVNATTPNSFVNATAPTSLLVPARGSSAFNVTVVAAPDTPPGNYTFNVTVSR